jgi:hypothetical protein
MGKVKEPKMKRPTITPPKDIPRPVMLAPTKKVANVAGKEGAKASVTTKKTRGYEKTKYNPKPTKAKATTKRKPVKRSGK